MEGSLALIGKPEDTDPVMIRLGHGLYSLGPIVNLSKFPKDDTLKRYQDYGIVSSTVMILWRASLSDMMILELLESEWQGGFRE